MVMLVLLEDNGNNIRDVIDAWVNREVVMGGDFIMVVDVTVYK